MTDSLSIVVGLLAGLLLGAFFFGGLWWTVRHGTASPRAALWFGASYIVRVAVLMAGLYALAHDNLTRAISAGVGVILARVAVALFSRASATSTVAGGAR